jgi:putative transposase
MNMANPAALCPGSYYHLFNRGTNRENIFPGLPWYSIFLQLFSYHVAPVVDTYAYCLLRNHFHFLIRVCTDEEILRRLGISRMDEKKVRLLPSRRFSNFFNSYAKKINLAYQRTGSLFQHPFRRVVVDTDRQLQTVFTYIHQNPQRHRLVSDYREWPFSSYHILHASAPAPDGQFTLATFRREHHPNRAGSALRYSNKEIAPLLLDDFR